MNDEPTQLRTRTHDDLLLDATVKYWWQRRKLIVAVMLPAVIVFAVCLLLLPESYRAQASVIIMPPRFIPEVRTQPLTVTTAQSLLQTHELYQQVIFTLRRHHDVVSRLAGNDDPDAEVLEQLANLTPQQISAAVGSAEEEAGIIADYDRSELAGLLEFDADELQEMTVDSVAEMFSSEEAVEKKTASELTYSPVLQLFAVADTGNKAQVMANTWARLFEKKYEQVTRGQTQRLFESLENQQEAGQEELENIQKILVDFRLKNNLDLIQRQINDYTDSFSSYSQSLVVRSNELVGYEAQMITLVGLVGALEGKDGGWIGGVQFDIKSSGVDVLEYSDIVSDNDSVPSVTLLRREALRSRTDLVRAMTMASDFQAANPLDSLIAEEQRLRTEYMELKNLYSSSLVKAEVYGQTLQELDTRINETSQVLSLSTALPDEVVGQALTENSNPQIQRAASLELNREQLNPLWKNLVSQRAEVAKNLSEMEATVRELVSVLPGKKNELDELANRVFDTRQAEEMVALQVERYSEVNNDLFRAFSDMKNQLFSTAWKITLLQEEVASLESAVAKTRAQIEALRESYEAASAQVEIINLRKKAVEQRADLLTQKLQESLVAVGEEVSDVSLASKAVPPTKHFFPPRTILLAVMTFITAAILLAGLSRRRYLELSHSQRYSAHSPTL